jgi:Flp pilus assembly protein TadG
MKVVAHIKSDERGVAAVEMAFALPIFIIMVWAFIQLAQVYRAMAGIQQALGQGARYATLCLTPAATGCTTATPANIKKEMEDSVYGVGPGVFTAQSPTSGTAGSSLYYDLTVSYTQPTSLLLLPGPTISVSRSKRVWVAAPPPVVIP